jgi:TRAP-type C4-dicarboxylate transport system permease small subunit
MNPFWKLFDRLLDVLTAIAGVVLVLIVAAVCYSVFMRFLFTQTTIWIMQTTEYGLLWIVFLVTAWLLREGGHISNDIIYSRLSDKSKEFLDSIMFTVGGLASAVMTYFGTLYTIECIEHNVTDVRAVTVPKALIFFIIPLGSLLLTIQFFRMALNRFSALRAGR